MIPGEVDLLCNWRFSTESTAEELEARARAILDKYNLKYEANFNLSGHPFLTAEGPLVHAVEQAIQKYLDDLDGELPCNLFDTVISEIEQPMLKTVLRHCDNNQSRTASCLGINRGTLRKKLKQYHIDH